MESVEVETVEWLWWPYVPVGKLTLLEGDPGVGKSWLGLEMAACVSSGRSLPGLGPQEPKEVLLVSFEDGLGDTIRPRLDAMGAGLGKVTAVTEPFTLDGKGMRGLAKTVEGVRPALVLIDTLTAVTGGSVDAYRANQVRAMLGPLAKLAEDCRTAIVAIRHWVKGDRRNLLSKGAGSVDFTAVARSVLAVAEHPEDEDLHVMMHVKSNLAPKGDSWAYRLGGGFTWEGRTDVDFGLLANGEERGGKVGPVKQWLREVLSRGPMRAAEIQEETEATERTLRRAKKALGVESEKKSDGWWWSLPGGVNLASLPRRPKNE